MKKIMPFGFALLSANLVFAADEIHYTISGNDSVTFDWRGTAAENSIGFGLAPGSYTQVIAKTPNPMPKSSLGPFWEAKLTGLKQNSLYYYSIGNGPERTFRTAPISGNADFTVFAQGDIGDTTTYFNTGIVQDLIANNHPSFVIGLGDLTLGASNGKAAVDQHFNDVTSWSKEAAYMPVWGDQESRNNLRDDLGNYKGRFDLPNPQTSTGTPLTGGEDWYWFDYGNARFISLPDSWPGAWAEWNSKANVLMAEAQTNPNIKFIVTMAHKPAYSSGHYSGSADLKAVLDVLGDRYNKYKLNLNSHSRNYERSYPQHGVVHVTAGIGGSNLQQDGACLWLTCAQPSWSAFRAMRHGALKLYFSNSAIEGSFVCGPSGGGTNDLNCSTGSVADRFTITSLSSANTSSSNTTNLNSTTALAAAAVTAAALPNCTQTALTVSNAISEGGFSYQVIKSFGIPADNSAFPTRSTLRLFENGTELAPAHSSHADIRNKGLGRFSHKTDSDGEESIRFSSSNNSNPKTNGKSYTYCTTTSTTTNSGTADTQAPSIPANLKAVASSTSQINLTWSASSDNKAVTGYKIYRNGVQIGTTSSTSYANTGLAAGTNYTYTVAAYDAAGNTSGNAISSSATTASSTTTVVTSSSCAPTPSSSVAVNVKDKGATGNGSTNDTAAIQAAINQIGGTGGTVLVPDGTYMIDSVKHLFLKSNMTLRMTSGAVLKAIPNNQSNYGILRVESASNVNIVGGKVQGERNQHQGSSGQWGHGIELYAANNIVIDGVTATDSWGDGFYISRSSANVTACSLVADNNRRQGLSITSVNGAVIKNSIFRNTNGFYPNTGIDIEPNAGEHVNNVQILNSKFHNNKGSGMELAFPSAQEASTASITNVTIDGNTVNNNGVVGTYSSGIKLSRQKSVKVTNNIIKDNVQDGILLVDGTTNNIVSGNTISGSGYGNNSDKYIGIGILIYDGATKNTISNNRLSGNKDGIVDDVGGNTISSNTIN